MQSVDDTRRGARPRSSLRAGLLAASVIANVVLVMFVAIEVTARLVSYGAVHWRADRRGGADAYFGADWPRDYYDEFIRSAVAEWQPYVYWRLHAYNGRFINVDENGIRRTWQPVLPEVPRRVFVMGGSTVWGTGARDDYTIPSQLARALADAGWPAAVTNFGETGYVTRQDVTRLISELKAGNVPDVVVFHGGINDVFSAFQSGRAGIPQNETNRALEFQAASLDNARKIARFLTIGTQTVVDVLQVWALRRAAAGGNIPVRDPSLPAAVVDAYCADVRLVRALAAEYGFRPLFFWQPVIFTKPALSEYEQRERDRLNYAREFFARAYSALSAARHSCGDMAVNDLSGLFAQEPRPIYVDALHVSELGNQLIAQAMVAPVAAALDGVASRSRVQ